MQKYLLVTKYLWVVLFNLFLTCFHRCLILSGEEFVVALSKEGNQTTEKHDDWTECVCVMPSCAQLLLTDWISSQVLNSFQLLLLPCVCMCVCGDPVSHFSAIFVSSARVLCRLPYFYFVSSCDLSFQCLDVVMEAHDKAWCFISSH